VHNIIKCETLIFNKRDKDTFRLQTCGLKIKTMKTTHIEHIGIAVENLEKAIRFYEDVLGLTCYAVEEIDDQKVKTAFFQAGQTKIELLESTAPDGPIGKFIERKGQGIHHIAFAVPDVNKALKDAESKGIQLIDKKPRKGAEGLYIGFIHPKSSFGVLTEFCGHP
jgi:methylmalonyl-CoA/ethylmalonyl-CoA epimerase